MPAGNYTDVKLADIVRGAGRYTPVVAVVLGIIVLAVVLPGPRVIGTDAGSQFGSPPATLAPGDTTTTTAPPLDVLNAPAAPLGGASTFPSSSSSSSSSFSSEPGTTSGAFSDDDDDRASATTVVASRPATRQPLRIAEAAWASRQAGTPLATAGVPEGALPVGVRVGQDDKRTFIRVEGDESTLTLKVVEGEGNRSPETAVIQACQIQEPSWGEEEAMAFDAGPDYDTEDCIAGERQADGSWRFNLSAYPQRDDRRGFALVPGPNPPIDFQIAFSRS